MRKTRIDMRTFLLSPPDSMSNISIGSGVGCAPTGPFLLPIEQVRRRRVLAGARAPTDDLYGW